MDMLHVAGERARRRRKIIVLDESCRIAYVQNGSRLDDRLFVSNSPPGEAPKVVERLAKRALMQWETWHSPFSEICIISADGNAIRVFPMLEGGRRRIGVMLERPKRRSRDTEV